MVKLSRNDNDYMKHYSCVLPISNTQKLVSEIPLAQKPRNLYKYFLSDSKEYQLPWFYFLFSIKTTNIGRSLIKLFIELLQAKIKHVTYSPPFP